MSKDKIINEFEENLSILEALRPRLRTLIEILIKEKNIIVHDVQARVKEKQSLEKKIIKKDEKYNDLKDITDIVGVRIITYFNEDVDILAKMIEQEFKVDKENSIDKRITDPDRFGYASLHYVVEFREDRLNFIEYKDFNNIKFEIQIRSILQHAWAEIEHDLGYKTKNELPKDIRRDFSRISSLLEIADNEFFRIKNYLEEYEKEIEQKIENDALDVEIDKISLKEYMEKSTIVNDISIKMANAFDISNPKLYYSPVNSTFSSLEYFGIKSIFDLDNSLRENQYSIVKFFERWLRDSQVEISPMNKSIVVFYLFFVLVYKDYTLDNLKGYLEATTFDGNSEKKIKERYEQFKEEGFVV